MSRFFLIAFLTVLAGFFVYQAAGATELFLKKKGTEQERHTEEGKGRKNSKSLGGGRELYNKSNKRSYNPMFATPSLTRRTTVYRDKRESPFVWGMMDASSRKIKEAQSDQVEQDRRELSKSIDKENAAAADFAKKQMEKEKAKSKQNGTTEKPKSGTEGSKKKGTVIKREKDPAKGKPRRVFNTLGD